MRQARRVAAPGGGFWDVIPGNGQVCLFIESEGGGGCTSAADAAAGRLLVAVLPPPVDDGKGGFMEPTNVRATYLGVAPTGATQATATGTSEPVTSDVTSNGLYRVLAGNTARTITLSRDGASSLTAYDASAGALDSCRGGQTPGACESGDAERVVHPLRLGLLSLV
ncbi:MAG TPA: hypothetical protein VGO71_21200 [Baekduia sp.]|nr:hypothetical protein [Baekduia sp.]